MRFAAVSPLRTVAIAALCLVAAGILQDLTARLGHDETAVVAPPPEYMGATLDPRIIRRLLGVRLLLADLVWVDTMIKSDIRHEGRPYTPAYWAFRLVTRLDPDNLHAHYVAGMYLSVVKDDVKGALRILRDGVEYMQAHPYNWQEAWSLPFAYGYNLIFEENDLEEGSKWIRKAAAMEYAPQIVKTMAKHIATERGRLEVAARVLNDLYRHTTRADQKRNIEAKMLEIASRQEVAELNERFQEYLASSTAYALPKKKQFRNFLRSVGHKGLDLLNRRLELNDEGRIAPVAK